MKRGRLGRSLALGLFATCITVLNTGCVDRILQNALVGFGFGLGNIPVQFVADTVLGFLNPDDAAE